MISYWSTCTPANFFYAYENYNVSYFNSYYNHKSYSQIFNCNKLIHTTTGRKSIAINSKQINANTGAPNKKKRPYIIYNNKFNKALLKEEKESRQDLEYWIDYIHLFGISHKIPKYDHMSFIVFHNLDILGAVLLTLLVIYKICSFCICSVCCRPCCKAGEKKKEDSDKPKKKGDKGKVKKEW